MVNFEEVGEQFLVTDPHQLGPTARKIMEAATDHTIWLFEGEMGAGKTTLIQALCAEMGVTDPVTSPTYNLINEYRDQADQVYYHFDFYRLTRLQEALDIGCEEYFDSGNICLIEWPGLIRSILPDVYFTIAIAVRPDDSRLIKLTRND
jgi:tRNA threonylcarbamoyladenosine biosynthesis protein TsaE